MKITHERHLELIDRVLKSSEPAIILPEGKPHLFALNDAEKTMLELFRAKEIDELILFIQNENVIKS